ncbi:MAG TPA: hypothetical protein VGI88_13390, partial [Verrucomicrobiae bacterium]
NGCWKCAGQAPELILPKPNASQQERSRVLLLRLLSLEILPVIASLLLSACWQRMMSLFFLLTAMAIFANVSLSLYQGVVSRERGRVCERHKHGRLFWFCIAVHAALGVFFLFGSALVFTKP